MAKKKPITLKSTFYTAVSLVWIFGLAAIAHIVMVLIEKHNPVIKYDYAWGCAIIESGRKDIDAVAIPADQNIVDPILVAVLKSTRDHARAQALIDTLRTEAVRKRLRDFRLLEAKAQDAR